MSNSSDNIFNKDNNVNSGMDEILASIRSYVSHNQNDAVNNNQKNNTDTHIIELTKEKEVLNLQDDVVNFNKNNDNINPFQKITKEILKQNEKKDSINLDKEKATGDDFSSKKLLEQLASPLIKEWLDINLTKIVEKMVQKEIDNLKNR